VSGSGVTSGEGRMRTDGVVAEGRSPMGAGHAGWLMGSLRASTPDPLNRSAVYKYILVE